MQLDPRPQLTPLWTLHSKSSAPLAVDRTVSWSSIDNVPAEMLPSGGADPIQQARYLGIQILGARTD